MYKSNFIYKCILTETPRHIRIRKMNIFKRQEFYILKERRRLNIIIRISGLFMEGVIGGGELDYPWL